MFKEIEYIQDIIEKVPAIYAEQLAQAYILGMRDMERYYGASKTTGDIIGFAIDEMVLKVKFRKIDLLEGVDL